MKKHQARTIQKYYPYKVNSVGVRLSFPASKGRKASPKFPKEKRFKIYDRLAEQSQISPTNYNPHISLFKLIRSPCSALMKTDSIFSKNEFNTGNFVMVGSSVISSEKPYCGKYSKRWEKHLRPNTTYHSECRQRISSQHSNYSFAKSINLLTRIYQRNTKNKSEFQTKIDEIESFIRKRSSTSKIKRKNPYLESKTVDKTNVSIN